mgnify:FL=1
MKNIFVLLLMIPSLSWGLTFKSDGSVVDKQGNLLSQKEVNSNDDNVSYIGDINKYNYSHTNVLDGKIDFVFGGKYINKKSLDPKTKRYFLPNNTFERSFKKHFPGWFYKQGISWGNFDNEGHQDIIVGGTQNACMPDRERELQSGGSGTCESDGLLLSEYPQIVPFTIKGSKLNEIENQQNKLIYRDKSYGNGAWRVVIDDFNKDGIDDFFIPVAVSQFIGNDWVSRGPNQVFVSNKDGYWEQSKHTGYLVDKKSNTFMGFSHGVTANDIDKDGDTDLITTYFEGSICHINDGQGNFNAKICHPDIAFAITSGDFNNDGNIDIVTAGHHCPGRKLEFVDACVYGNQGVKLVLGDGKGNFKKTSQILPWASTNNGKFVYEHIVEMTTWDFDNDGDLDIAGSHVGPWYSGGVMLIYENVGGQFKIADTVDFIKPNPDWVDKKSWNSEIKHEAKGNYYNSYCHSSILIDVNLDEKMDIYCDAVVHDAHNGYFFINEGDLKFKKMGPDEMKKTGWVNYYPFFNDFNKDQTYTPIR